MEDNTLDFLNPLEPLGTPGNTNLSSNIPAINDPLKDPVINFPKDSVPLTYMQTREDLVDRPDKNSNLTEQTIDREQILKSLGNMWKGKTLSDISGSAKSKAYSYDNSADSGSFYKRYAAYGQEKFDKIGFSPLRDNEAIFNENTSRWNDFSRMMTHSWWPLFSQGFIAGPKSLYRAIQGDFGVDLEDASVYAEAAAIGQSSKGGLGSFMSNAFMNFAYTAGIITESILEMGVASLLAAPTGGSSLVLSGANLGRKGLMLGKGLDNLRKAGVAAPGLERAASKALTGMEFTNSLKNLKQIENARSVFKWAKAEKAMSSPVGRFINPFAELTEGVAAGLKASQNLKGWAKTMSMAKHTAGGLYRNVHTINAALAEARLEGGMVENNVFDQLYRSLTPEERNNEAKLKDIRLEAQMAGEKAKWANVGIIYASNKIVFDNIYGGKGPISRLMNKRTKDIMDLKTGKLRIVKPGRFGKAKDLKKPVVEYTKNNFKNMVKDFAREPLRKSTRGAVVYFKGNVMEGLQENAQEAIAHAAENYYIESFKNPDLANSEFARAQILHGIQEQFTAQGFETFASGFAMGAFAGPLNSAPKWASIGYNRIADPKAYADYVTKRDNYGAKLAETLNNVDVKDFFDNPIWNYSSQSQVNKSLFEASTEEEVMAIKGREIREDAFIKAMSVAMEKGMMDVYYEQIDSAAKMTQEEFEEAYGLEKGAGKEYLANIGKIRERAEAVETRWKEAKELFPEPEDIGEIMDNANKDSLEYEQAALLLSAWKEARKNYVFFNETFENTKDLMQDLSNDIVSLTSKMGISSTDVKVLFDKNLLSNEIGLLKTDIELVEGMETLTSEQKKELKEKKEKLESLTQLKAKIIGFENINLDKQEITERIMDAILEAEISKLENLLPKDKKKRIEELTKEAKEQAEIIYETKKELIDSRAQELEIAFKDYIRTLNKDKDYEFKDGVVDSVYQKFKRFYELDYNQKEMAKLLNIVGDEQGYLDMVQNNMVWMKKLYDNRKGYYEEMIKKGFENLENNDLLNALAAQGIYISEEALEDWVENANIPEEFILQDKEAVIKEGHHQYLTYARLFANVARNRKTKTSDLELKQYYEAKDKLIKERDAAIAALPTTFTRTNTVTLDITTPSTLEKFANQIGPETYVELTYTENKEDKTLIVFQDKDGLFRYDDAEGNPFRDNTTKFKAGQVFIMSEKPDPAEVEKINQEYAQKINEIDAKIQKYKAQNKEPYVNITKDTPYSELPSELKNKLIEAYRAHKNEIGAPVPVDAEISEDDVTNFIKTNIKAKNIIDRYNAEMNAINEQPVNYDPVFVDKDGVEKKASEFTEKELKDKLLILDNDIEKLEKKKDLTPEESAELETYRNLKIAIEGYLQHVSTLNFTEAQRKIQALFQEKVLDIQDQILTPDITNSEYYEVNGSKKARVTNLIRDLKKDSFVNTDLVNIVDLYDQFLKGKEISNEDLDAFKKAFSAKSFQGFNYTNTQNKFLRALGKNVTKNLSEEDFINLVNTYQWQESRDAGNYIHKGAENLFYGIPVEKDPSVISDEAYEQLFGGQGFIRKVVQDLKSKNMVLLGVESMVYGDEYAGTIDMLAVDPEGVIHIIDIKTGKEKKWKDFVNASDLNRESYGLQLAAYSALLQGMLGTKVEFSTKVLPVQVTYDKSGKVTSAKSPEQVKGLLTPNDNYIDININETNPLLEDSPINKIRSKIPLTSAPGETIKVATAINPLLKEKLIKAGIPESVINQMTKEEQAEFLKYEGTDEETAFIQNLIANYNKTINEKSVEPANIKIRLERKSNESVKDFIERLFSNNYFTEVDGKEIFSLTQGRWGVIVNINGLQVPFYQSTSGTDTKVKGQWYPFFGDLGNWVIKGNSDESNVGYGFKAIQEVQQFLNNNIKEADAIVLSGIVPTEVVQNQNDLRKLNEYQIKGNEKLSLSRESTAKILADIVGYSIEEAKETTSDSELFELASKKIFAELKALEEQQAAPAQESTVILDSFTISEDASLVEPGYSKLYESYAKQMNEASTINDAIQIFNQAAADTNISIDELKSLKDIGAALRKKLPEPSSTQTEVLTLDKVNAGDILTYIETGQTYKVFKIGDNLIANNTDPKNSEEHTLDAKNISNFVKTSEVGKTVKKEPVSKKELTEEEKEALKNTKDGVDVFLIQKDIKAQNQKEVGDKVSSEKLDTLKNNLLNDILC